MLRLSCVVHGPIYGRFMGKRFSLYIKVHTQVAQARQTSALLRNIRSIRICTGKKPIVSVTYENERISIKKKTAYLHREKTVYIKTHKTAINRPVDHTGET